jgi:threonine dehydrogenase-like Zn-dependent dehydrogenase
MTSTGEEVRSVVLMGYGGYECLKVSTSCFDELLVRGTEPQTDATDRLFPQVQPWPTRDLGAGDVRVAVAVCGLNFSDLYTRQGLLRNKQPPFVLGIECAGEVTAVGASVTHISVSKKYQI